MTNQGGVVGRARAVRVPGEVLKVIDQVGCAGDDLPGMVRRLDKLTA